MTCQPHPTRAANGQNLTVHIVAKVDCGLRALASLAVAGSPQTAEALAVEQDLPPRHLGAILADLRRAGTADPDAWRPH